MSKPKRIQLSREKGWRKPPGAVVVARPSKWGNPFPVVDGDYAEALRRYNSWLAAGVILVRGTTGSRVVREACEELRGKDLACWCPLGQPCHADVLLRIANEEPETA